MFCVRRCSDAGPAGRWQVLASRYCTECPKQGSERFNCQVRRNTLPIWVCYLFLGDWKKQICICICRPIDNFHCSFFLSIQQNNLFIHCMYIQSKLSFTGPGKVWLENHQFYYLLNRFSRLYEKVLFTPRPQ